MYNLFLTGEIRIGKTTILQNALEKVNSSIGGYITERNNKGDMTTFTVRSLYDCVEKFEIATINTKEKTKNIFKDSFEIRLPSILDNSFNNRDLIILDELGFMENDIDSFTSRIYRILDSEKPVFGVLKDFDCEFLNNIKNRDDTILLTITERNRDTILDEVLNILKSFGISIKNQNSFMWNKRSIEFYNEALDHPSCDYPRAFIEEIKKYTGPLKGKTILDIGAGTGAFTLPLMKEGALVTAVDSSFSMLSSLYEKAKREGLDNFTCIIGPFETSQPREHDIAISAFSKSSTKTLEGIQKMHNLVHDYAFIISSFENHDYNFNRDILYKMLDRAPKKSKTTTVTLADTLELLDEYGCDYECKKIKYEFSQYFKDFDEALEFFMIRYDISTAEEVKITKEFLNTLLIKTEDQYKFLNNKESYLIAIRSK